MLKNLSKKKVILSLVIFIFLVLFLILVFTMAEKSIDIPDKENDSLRFVAYNMMFGMYGREGLMDLLGHLSFHGIHSPFFTKVFSRFNNKTIRLINQTSADVVCLNEVLGSLKKEEIVNGLKKQGYNYFCWGAAIHHDKPLDIGTLIASKEKFSELNFSMPQKAEMGGGAGACAVYLKKRNLVIIGVHLATFEEGLVVDQIKAISDFVRVQQKLKRKIVLLGDFNREDSWLNSKRDFKILNLTAANKKATVPNVLEFKLFYFKSFDNIFYGEGLELINSGTFNAYSDHKLVWADLKL